MGQLRDQELPGDVVAHIIVVVDGSTDGTIELLTETFPDVHIVSGTGNWWFTKSLNEGCKRALMLYPDLDFILTMNDDCHISNKLVKQLYEDYLQLPAPGVIGAITLIPSNPARVTFSGTKHFSRSKVKLTPYRDNRLETDPATLKGVYPTFSLMTRGMLFPVEIGERIHWFDEENLPQYGSDDDFVLRTIKAGYGAWVSWNAHIYDEPLLTSMGSAITKPTFKAFRKSFFNPYSVNSFQKTYRFQKKHGYRLLLPFNMLHFIAGTTYAYLWKYRK